MDITTMVILFLMGIVIGALAFLVHVTLKGLREFKW